MAENVIKERCAEESDSFIESLVDIMHAVHEGKTGIVIDGRSIQNTLEDIASRKARDLSKCILKKEESQYGW